MCACLKPQKNPLAFVRAARIVKDSYPEAVFVLAGDGELKEKVESLVQELDMRDSLFIPGWIGDINGLLSRTNVFVLTSLHEGLPMALLEAMAKGIPVVASAVDGIKDIIQNGKNGLIFAPEDTEGFSRAILSLLKEETKLAIDTAAIEEEFSEKKNLERIEALYKKLIYNND